MIGLMEINNFQIFIPTVHPKTTRNVQRELSPMIGGLSKKEVGMTSEELSETTAVVKSESGLIQVSN